MKSSNWLALHRWVGISAAFFLLAWIVSGVVLLLPGSTPAPDSARDGPPLPATEMTVSPSAALTALSTPSEGGAPPAVRSIRLHRVGGRPAYRIATRDGPVRLVDARTGEEFDVTRDLATRIATDAYPTAAVQSVERIDAHSLVYQYGPLPAFRVVFDDGDGTWAYVSGKDGALTWSDRSWRVRAGIVAFHEFSFLPVLPGGDELRWLLLAVGVVASTTVLVTGVYLFVVWWIRTRRAGRVGG